MAPISSSVTSRSATEKPSSGLSRSSIISTTDGLVAQKWGGIVVDEDTCKTSKEAVYAGGDAVTGAATVILAMGAGKQAAASIDEYIQNKSKG